MPAMVVTLRSLVNDPGPKNTPCLETDCVHCLRASERASVSVDPDPKVQAEHQDAPTTTDGKYVTNFYDCLLGTGVDAAAQLQAFVDDPWAYVIDGTGGCTSLLVDEMNVGSAVTPSKANNPPSQKENAHAPKQPACEGERSHV